MGAAATAFVVLLMVLAACTDASADPPEGGNDAGSPSPSATTAAPSPTRTATAGARPAADATQLVAERPYRLDESGGSTGDTPRPLILVLHGYGQGSDFDPLGLEALAEREGALLAYPDGSLDTLGRRFWNAGEVCCNFFAQPVDDVAYLSAVIDDVARRRDVDARRVYVAGFSNGAFMAQRLACERPDRIAAIVSVSGVNTATPGGCEPSQAVAVLQVHGDADPIVHYLGGRFGSGTAEYPSVMASIEGWRDRNGCDEEPEVRETTLDVASALRGAETSVTEYTGCNEGGAAELWTVHGGSHDIEFSPAFAREVWRFLEEHGRG